MIYGREEFDDHETALMVRLLFFHLGRRRSRRILFLRWLYREHPDRV